jgi:predicted nucleotidyltransferase component of viral defense system
MKDYLKQLLSEIDDRATGIAIMREYLQARILEGLQREGAFQCIVFHGGTSLRFLYNIPRYSEHLDFALDFHPERYDFSRYIEGILKRFRAENYAVDKRMKENQTVVNKAMIRFRGLLYEMGLSPHDNHVFMIKVEVDTNPPPNAGCESTIIQRYVTDLHLLHHDRASLLAGKLQAVLNRMYIKGRDWYDLWWYLSQPDWPQPNFDYMNSGMRQAGADFPEFNAGNWKPIVLEKAKMLDWAVVNRDVQPFIINGEQQTQFNKARLLELLEA